MPLVSVLVAIGILLVLVLALKLDAFFALILTAFVVGLMNSMDVLAVLQSLLKVFGAMLGRLVGESGAARAIAEWLVRISGTKRMQFAMAATGILVGMPMLYNAGFIVVIPLVYSVAATTGLPLVSLTL